MPSADRIEDYNILGITAPANTRWISWESVRDDLGLLLQQHPTPTARLAHVEGPHGSGKSTGMLEYIWDEIRSSSPNTTVIYVPAFDCEAILLSAYLESDDSPYSKLKGNTRAGLEIGIEPKLYLATIHELRDAIRKDAIDQTLPGRVMLLLDLEIEPTCDGELLLSELACWCRHRLSQRLSEFTLITMAQFSRPPVHKLLEDHLQARCYRIVMAGSDAIDPPGPTTSLLAQDLPLQVTTLQRDTGGYLGAIEQLVEQVFMKTPQETEDSHAYRQTYLESLDRSLRAIDSSNSQRDIQDLTIKLLNGTRLAAPLVKQAPCIIIFLNAATDHNLIGNLEKLVKVYRVTKYATLPEILEMILWQWPKVICIESSFPVVLHIPRVGAVVSISATCARVVFDASTSQLQLTDTPKSRMELLREQSYVFKSHRPGADPVDVPYFFVADVSCDSSTDAHAHFDNWKLVPEAPAYGADVMRLSLELCAPWPRQDRERGPSRGLVPLPAMSDTCLLEEMWRRLVHMGCLSRPEFPSERPKVNGPRAQRTLQLLEYRPKSALNQDREVPLAYFIAGIEDVVSNPAKRVMIRIAVLIDRGSNSIKHPDYIQKRLDVLELDPRHDTASTVLSEIALACYGVGDREFDHGDVWIKLGLLLRTESEDQDGEDDRHAATIHGIPLDIIQTLECCFGLETSQDPIRDTELSPEEVDIVNLELMRSWLYNIVWFHRASAGAETTVVDLASYQPVEPESLSSLVIRNRFENSLTSASDELFAFSHAAIDATGTYRRVDRLTEIPKRFILRLMQEQGSEILETGYKLATN
ncbi:hypothetical protein F4818DRAFT_446004 [Hypoxylon cercidicola]|nr:hypothetical protein F4818DRAFT_446004 [Hypoxylon cercidicola]